MSRPVLYSVNNKFPVIEITNDEFSIGRSIENNQVVQERFVSKVHCVFKRDQNVWFIIDKSTNGTKLNASRLKKDCEYILEENAVIELTETIKFVYSSDNLCETNQPLKMDLPEEENQESYESMDYITIFEGPDESSPFINKHEVMSILEGHLQCSICNELVVKSTTLNCSHSFCKMCISKWQRNQRNCPVCRAYIKFSNSSLAVDNLIDNMIQKLCPHMVEQREELKESYAKVDIPTVNTNVFDDPTSPMSIEESDDETSFTELIRPALVELLSRHEDEASLMSYLLSINSDHPLPHALSSSITQINPFPNSLPQLQTDVATVSTRAAISLDDVAIHYNLSNSVEGLNPPQLRTARRLPISTYLFLEPDSSSTSTAVQIDEQSPDSNLSLSYHSQSNLDDIFEETTTPPESVNDLSNCEDETTSVSEQPDQSNCEDDEASLLSEQPDQSNCEDDEVSFLSEQPGQSNCEDETASLSDDLNQSTGDDDDVFDELTFDFDDFYDPTSESDEELASSSGFFSVRRLASQ